ncbi:hypothetical protein ACFMPD_09950 [Sedimentitalea sp. HM32M-2]|uniref:hypothetical protein n=1 Tax=Sedimentitalea sp. HM32M-2 TaxID=3351566 RepID=UPI0036332C59
MKRPYAGDEFFTDRLAVCKSRATARCCGLFARTGCLRGSGRIGKNIFLQRTERFQTRGRILVNFFKGIDRTDDISRGRDAQVGLLKGVTWPTVVTMGIGYFLLLILVLSTIWMAPPV